MENLLGLLIIAAGRFGQSSSYVPVNKVRQWSWESFWLVQGIFAWLVFPFAGAMLAVPEGSTLWRIIASEPASSWSAICFGALWGVGGLTFGLSMRYLGIAMGQSVSLGTCAAFGTLFPAIASGADLFSGAGLALLGGVCITMAGIAVIGYAGSLRSKELSGEERNRAVKEFALTKGLAVALLAGVMSACFALGLDAGPVVEDSPELFRTLPATFLVTVGGFFHQCRILPFPEFQAQVFPGLCQCPGAPGKHPFLRAGRFPLVHAVFRSWHRDRFFRQHIRALRFFLVHTDVAQCGVQQCMGACPQRVERRFCQDSISACGRSGHPGVLAGFP